MESLLTDGVGKWCCCDPPPCPTNIAGCPVTLSMNLVDHFVQIGPCVYQQSVSLSPYIQLFPPDPVWHAVSTPVGGGDCQTFGTFTSTVVSGPCNDSITGLICLGFDCGKACIPPAQVSWGGSFVVCSPQEDGNYWRVRFDHSGITQWWRSDPTACPTPGHTWLAAFSNNQNVIEEGTLSIS